jgi:hypothetical protein
MDQHHAGVYQIVRALRQRIASDVVAKDIQMWRSQRLEESRIDIRDEDTAGGADALAEPRRNRSASAPDFQAPPTCREAAIQQMALCRTIEDRRQRGEPRRSVLDWIHPNLLSGHESTLLADLVVVEVKIIK